jgi:hypothetical protein
LPGLLQFTDRRALIGLDDPPLGVDTGLSNRLSEDFPRSSACATELCLVDGERCREHAFRITGHDRVERVRHALERCEDVADDHVGGRGVLLGLDSDAVATQPGQISERLRRGVPLSPSDRRGAEKFAALETGRAGLRVVRRPPLPPPERIRAYTSWRW